MMRSLLSALAAIVVIALAYWAYHENYQTQQALREVEKLQFEIGQKRVELGMLKAEWAYLNRPDRLRDLVDLNFADLDLIPFSPSHFAEVDQVAFPRVDVQDLDAPVDVSASETEGADK